MNDFTKEELESIIQGFEHIEGDPAWRETFGWDDPLKVKIQSMIDNYCETDKSVELKPTVLERLAQMYVKK